MIERFGVLVRAFYMCYFNVRDRNTSYVVSLCIIGVFPVILALNFVLNCANGRICHHFSQYYFIGIAFGAVNYGDRAADNITIASKLARIVNLIPLYETERACFLAQIAQKEA